MQNKRYDVSDTCWGKTGVVMLHALAPIPLFSILRAYQPTRIQRICPYGIYVPWKLVPIVYKHPIFRLLKSGEMRNIYIILSCSLSILRLGRFYTGFVPIFHHALSTSVPSVPFVLAKSTSPKYCRSANLRPARGVRNVHFSRRYSWLEGVSSQLIRTQQ